MVLNENPEQFSLTWDARPCTAGDIALIFREGEVLLRPETMPSRLPLYADVATWLPPSAFTHACTQAGRRVFIATLDAWPQAAPLQPESVRVFRMLPSAEDGFLLDTAYHLWVWYRQHRFCGACGAVLSPAPVERALHCAACGLTLYPTIAPAVTTAITHGDHILLARNAHGPFQHYSLIAGYVEVGETLEQTVAREIKEEVGLRVRHIRYVGSQPWGLSQTLMLGFHAELEGSDAITLQESELAEARWFPREALEPQPHTASLSFEIIERFRQGTL